MAKLFVINLEKLSDDGYKMKANGNSVDNITHVQLRYTPFTVSEATQGAFVTGATSTVEFSIADGDIEKAMKLYTKTASTDYVENKTFGGTNGRQLY